MDYAQEAIQLGNLFQQIGQGLGTYIQNNIVTLINDQPTLNRLLDDQARIISYSNSFYSLGDKITFSNDQQYFQRVDQATQAINANLQTIKDTDKWIGFGASVISLGLSIVSGNGSGILSSVQNIAQALNIKL